MARGRVPAVAIELSAEEQRELEGLAKRRRSAQGLARRARIVLLSAEGWQNKAIAAALGADTNTVSKWRRRFAERRLEGLYDEPRPGAPQHPLAVRRARHRRRRSHRPLRRPPSGA